MQTGLRRRQGRQQDHQGHHDEVLRDQDADHDPARQRPHAALVHQGLEADHRAAERNQRPEPDRHHPGPAEQAAERGAEQDRQRHLDRRPDEGNPPDRLELLERELQAEGEQQERDADLGQQLDVVGVGDGPANRVRTDEHAGQDVAEDQRLAQRLGDETADQAGHDDDREVCGDPHQQRVAAVRPGSPSRRASTS